MIRTVHAAVPGRARLHVAALRDAADLARRLEERIASDRQVQRVRASALTGNVLVHYNSGATLDDIVSLLAATLDDLEEAAAPVARPAPAAKGARAATTGAGLIVYPPPLAPPPGSDDDAATDAPVTATGVARQAADGLRRLVSSVAETLVGDWHALDTEAVLARLGVDPEVGLTREAAAAALRAHGPNDLPRAAGRSDLSMFLEQFTNLPVALLGVTAGLALLTGGVLEAGSILAVVVANAVIGYATERSSERTIESLEGATRPLVSVLRDGARCTLGVEEVTVGDLLVLHPGTYVSADARVVQASALRVDESALTGESLPVVKTATPLVGDAIPLAERTNMVFRGTLVTGGEGFAAVVAVGGGTEIGRIQRLLALTEAPETPIERQLSQIGDQLVLLGLVVCGSVFLVGLARGYGLLQVTTMSVALAAAAVPEGLPAAATTTLALGVRRMRTEHALVRNLDAVETLGAVRTVCFDKTGTITLNQMRVLQAHAGGRHYRIDRGRFFHEGAVVRPVDRPELARLVEVGALCSETRVGDLREDGSWQLDGSPTENALVELAIETGVHVKKLRRRHALERMTYRSEDRLYMSSLHETEAGDAVLMVKGSPSEVLELCRWQLRDGERVPLDDGERLSIEAANERMGADALRVLGTAMGTKWTDDADPVGGDLTWLGLVGMADPVRDGVRDVVAAFHRAGVRPVMITGDQSSTAYAVAREIGLTPGGDLRILDSVEFSALSREALAAVAPKVDVYSRVSPAHKLAIVQTLQETGDVIAMTGDGINDGPALKAADVGIAMGKTGTDVAREVGDIVLEEDTLASLVAALGSGRTTFANIRKSVHFFLSTNLSEIMVMAASVAAGLGQPLNTMQLLWINVVSDIFPGLALSLEEAEPDVLSRPPRDPQRPLFDRADFRRMLRESGVITAGAMGAYAWGLLRHGPGARASSLAFHGLTVSQLVHAYSCRSERHRIYDEGRLPPNPWLDVAVLGSLALQAAAMFVPGLAGFLASARMGLVDTAVVAGTSVAALALNEWTKAPRGGDGGARDAR